MGNKICTCCKKERELFQFSPRKPRGGTYKDGRDYQCLICRAEKGTHKKKYKTEIKDPVKVEGLQKHYVDSNGKMYIKLRIGYKKVKSKKIVVNRSEFSTQKVIQLFNYQNQCYNYGSRAAKIKAKLQIECDSLWDKFCSLESLISSEAFTIIGRINQIEYLTV